jgi:hypothetical protein
LKAMKENGEVFSLPGANEAEGEIDPHSLWGVC